jgi:alkanesulfonate monooxygenase SsuD/methylene tetrahydromethanopterin reductase-like flavin-dependent oxidoreductase (luciferase family)
MAQVQKEPWASVLDSAAAGARRSTIAEGFALVEFGLQIEPQFGFSYAEVRDLARSLTDHGYTSLWVSDHFMLNRREPDRACMDCWTLLTAIAADVPDIRIGSLVTCISYRHPPVLAKIAATVDQISGGRLEFGVGAGWKDIEYDAYGIPFPPPGERVDRFLEGLQIIKSLWTESFTTFRGQYYSVTDAVSSPKPVQRPYPPVLIGGAKPRMLRAMARHADAINMLGARGPEEYGALLEKLARYCRHEGTDFDRLRKTHFMTFVVAEDERELNDLLKRISDAEGITVEEYRTRRARAFIGTVDDALDLINRYCDLGVTQFQTVFPYGEEHRSLDIFGSRIIPAVN